MKHLRKRLLAVFLAAVMFVTSAGTSSYAYEAEKKGNLSVTGKDGQTVEEEESWEEKFPNGTFAFKNDSITIEEGKNAKEQKITIYRLGGTKGKATAKVAITPAVAALDEDEKELVYANAASNKDYTVKVENPIGTDGTMGKQQVSSSYEVDAQKADGKVTLSLKEVKGEYVRYFWHVKKDGKWEAVSGGNQETLVVSEKDFEQNEYICVVEADYKLSLSKTTGEESSQKLWINLNNRHITDEEPYEKGSYTDVPLDGEMPFKTSFLQVDFEDGEWVKDIVVKATDDDEHEAEELASFTIYEVEGAAFTESANRLSMCIKDDEEKLESTMGFALSQIRVDKSTGKAKIKLTRTGATQYVSSVDYKTVDGSAKAGTDYAKAESTASFSGGIESAEIEIDLLNDNKKTEEDRYFTIELKNAKGGNIKQSAQEIRVNLFNTYTAEKDNVAPASKRKDAKDASARVKESDTAITENDSKEVKAKAVKQKDNVVSYEKVTDKSGDMNAQAAGDYSYKISTSDLSSQWGRNCNLTGTYTAQTTSDEGGNSMSGGDILVAKRRANTYYQINDLVNMYSRMSGSFWAKTSYSLYWAREYYSGLLVGIGNSSFATSLTAYTSDSGDGHMKNRLSEESKKAATSIFTRFGNGSETKTFDVNLDNIPAGAGNEYLAFKTAISKRGGTVRNRDSKVNSVNINLYRRWLSKQTTLNINLGDSKDKDRMDRASSGSVTAVKKGLKPVISIEKGGFDSDGDGKFYLGTELKVKETDTLGVYQLDKVELKEGSNSISLDKDVDKSTIVKYSNNGKRLSTTADYTLNCEYNRYQTLEINCKTSMTQKDTDQEKTDKFTAIGKNIKVDGKTIDMKSNAAEYMYTSSDKVVNFNKINFGLSDGTKILYGDKVYDGDSDIIITDSDIVSNTITFSVYTPDSVSVVRDPEIISEKLVAIYKDKNGDGKYTEDEDGIKPIKILKAGEPYQITDFGKDVVIKVDYSVQPASLNTPPGATGKETFQVVPGFVTTQTSEEQKKNMTEEQKAYRDISAKDGSVKMYGAVSSGTVSFLSGYDASPAKMNDSKKKYEWTPNWQGNLRKAYKNPAEIKVYETKMPNGFTAASTSEQINGYLGCLHGNETYYITSRVTTGNEEKITSTKRGGFYTVPEPAAQAFESEDAGAAEAPEDPYGTTANQPSVADTSPGVSLPEIEIGLGYGTFMMDDDEIGFSVGTPVFGMSKEGTEDAEKDVMGAQGLKEMKEAMSDPSNNIFKQLKKNAGKSDGTGNSGNGAKASPAKKAEIDIAVNMSFVWKYSKLTGKYEFSSAMIALAIEGSVRLQYRFQCCPIFYVYVQIGMELEAQTGIELEKEEVTNADGTTSIKNNVSFAGLKLNPSLYVEAGAGVGVDLAKLEIYVKVSVSFAFTINKQTQVDEFITSAAVGFRVVFLFFSYEMDVIGCKAGFDRERAEEGKSEWFFSWQVAGRDMDGSEEEVDNDVAGARVTVSKPQSYLRLQKINSSDDNAVQDEMSGQSYKINGIDEFEVSGYGNNASAVELGSGLNSASDYKLLTVRDTNYVLYTISRNTTQSFDKTQLVLSKLSTTSTGEGGEEGKETMGLVNPVDETSETKYIAVDFVRNGPDGTGDLDFNAVVEGSKIKVTWTSYSDWAQKKLNASAPADELLKTASKYIDVKTAEFDTESSTTFSQAVTLREGYVGDHSTGTPMGYSFLPSGTTSDVYVYADTEPYTEAELAEREAKYKEKYDKDAEGNNSNNKSGTGDPYAKANYEYALTTDFLYGKYSKLHFSVKQDDGTYQTIDVEPSDDWKKQGTRLENVQITEGTNNDYFISYTTEQKGDYEEEAKIKKLYVQKAAIKTEEDTLTGDTKKTLELGDAVLLKTLVDYEDSDEKDGEYSGGTCVKQVDSPNISNLKFLHGKLTDSGEAETFLMYTMNGVTYVIKEASLENALNSKNAEITVDPLFTVEKDEKEKDRGNSQADATIGVDGDGNISAVYTQAVANTVNNALYVTKYDPTVGKFGEAFMLAMNHMQVYEDSVSNQWTSEDTRAAFYDSEKGGGEDQFIFNAPQIALGKATEGNESGTLTILTKGTMTKLMKTSLKFDGESYEEYVPDSHNTPTSGIYAITYGIGDQKIGEASITFDKNNFVSGAELSGSVSFRNTGDVAIRGSKKNPISISLKAQGANGDAPAELAKWKVESNILAGQQVTTDAIACSALPKDIAGGKIYIEVQEDSTYVKDAKVLSTDQDKDGRGMISVGKKAELSIDSLEITASDTLEKRSVNNISCVLADVNMTVSNKGVEDASNVKFQVKRSAGKTDGSEDKYIPLEIGGNLIVADDGKETALLGNGDDKGVFEYLAYKDTSGVVSTNQTIPAGKTQTIQGKIVIPLSAFDPEDAVGAANLQFTLKSDAEEYETRNNTEYGKVVPATRFDCLDKVSLTVGNPVNFTLKMQAAMDSSKRSNITLTEMKINKDGKAEVATDNKLLQSAAYNVKTGYVTVTAQKEGSGVLRIADTTTGSFKDITFAATVSGCNIRTDNPVFEFTDALHGQKWEDIDIGAVKEGTVLPYNSDICTGGEGNSFTFTTYARSIDFYYTGDIEVSSNNRFGFVTKQYKDRDGEEVEGEYYKRHTVDFNNTSLKKHTVTVKVINGSASFDRMVEYYSERSEGDTGRYVPEDKVKPTIVIGKTLPTSGTKLQPGTVLEIPVYAYDDVMLNSVSIGGNGADKLVNNQFAEGTLKIRKNGTYHVIVEDSSGNIKQQHIDISCFDEEADKIDETTDDWPDVTMKLVDESGNPITDYTTANAYIAYDIKADRKIKSVKIQKVNMQTTEATDLGSGIKVTGNETALSDTYDVNLSENGYYQMVVTDAADNATTAILSVEYLTKGPQVYLYTADGVENQLFYCVGDEDNEIPLKEAAVYEGKVTATNETGSIEVEGKEPLMRKSYTTETMDSGTVALEESTSTKEFTIAAQDVSGKLTTYIYTDATCLNSLAVGSAEDLAYGVKLNGEFKPYQRNYTVDVPYGYPENQLPEVNATCASGATINKNWDGDVLTIKVTKDDMENTYTLTLKRKKCTCDISIRTYDDYVDVPKTGEKPSRQFDVQTDVTLCEVHKDHTQDNVKLSYELTDEAEGTLPEENASIESPVLETDAASIQGNKIVFNRIAEGTTPSTVHVKVKAKTDSCERSKIITYTVRNKYDVGLQITEGGEVHCGEDILTAQSESSSVEQHPYSYEVNTGFELELKAAEKEGYEFAGWYDSSDKLLSKENDFIYTVGKDETIRAMFKDIVEPKGSITLTDLNGAQNVITSDEGDILVSSKGFLMEIAGEDEHSGIKSISYQIVKQGEKLDENGKWISYDGKPITLEEEMDFVVYAKIVDQDDNEVIVSSNRAMIEKSAAAIHLAPNFAEGTFTNKKDAAIVATVQKGTAALKEIRYVVNGEEKTTEETVFGISDLPDGVYDVTVYAKDILGKEVSAKVSVKKDAAEPVLSITGVPTSTVEKAALGIEATGGVSGIKEIRVNGKPYTGKTYEVTENGTYVFELENNAGSVTTKTITIQCIVKPTPAPDSSTVPTVNKNQLPRTTFVRRKNIKKKGVRITWKGVRGAQSYNVYRAKKANGKYKLVANVKESCYTSKKKNARKYYYKVVAVAKKKKNNSEMSAYAISANVDKAAASAAQAAAGTKVSAGKIKTLKGKVTKVKAKAKKGRILVSWKKHKKASGYIVYRAESKYGVYDEFAIVKKNSFKDKYSVKGRKFYYKIRAYKNKGNGKILSGISKKTSVKAK